jgi:GT2 family glycosyltransferase/ADP-heptose:LPS heptosyltransferase
MDLSIIVPTYNRNGPLAECLQSLEHNGAEFIVVDDGSPTPVQAAPNVRILRHESHRGRAAAVNTGLRAATHNLTLIIDDDIYAAPDMVARLVDEFAVWNNPKLALVGRIVCDPELRMTLTMRWLEELGPDRGISSRRSGLLSHLVTTNTMMWRPFVLQHGGFDETFTTHGLADVELGLRLKLSGLEVRLLANAIGFHHRTVHVRDLIQRELQEGHSAVYVHSKFPDYLPQIDDVPALLQNAANEKDALSAVEEIALLEQADSSRLQSGISDLFMLIHRHYFLTGILNGLATRESDRPSNGGFASLSLYSHASYLASIGELSEARRLFRLVRNRPDSELWSGAEYQLGLIEAECGDAPSASRHFMNCIALEPDHTRAREKLKRPDVFREIEQDVFERIETLPEFRILFVLFGEVEDVLKAFPVVAALREKHRAAEIVWLTSAKHSSLARASFADGVCEFEPIGAIPWDWAALQGFTHIFDPMPAAHKEQSETESLHPIDFMAKKCGVTLESRKAWLEPGSAALLEAESFLTHCGLSKKSYLTIYHAGEMRRLWPSHNLHKLATAIGLTVVVIGEAGEFATAGTVPCFGRSPRVVAALIRWSAFYMGPDFGVSWIASTCGTPMGIFIDSTKKPGTRAGVVEILTQEKEDVVEWNSQTNTESIIEHIASKLQATRSFADPGNSSGVPLS